MTCKDCIHFKVCAVKGKHANYKVNNGKQIIISYENPVKCKRYGVNEHKTALWERHSPDVEKMREFHKLGIGKAMGERSVFWTCSNCKNWGTPAYEYCPSCGIKIVGIQIRG